MILLKNTFKNTLIGVLYFFMFKMYIENDMMIYKEDII